jgi:hypothetical protein
MPEFRVNMDIKQKGQIFNASASKAQAARMVIEVNEGLAKEGVARIRAYLWRRYKHPTGYYNSNIVVSTRQTYRGITDNKVVYGGWLEGVSSRNKTTRFKGYRAFRTIKEELNRDKAKLAQPFVDAFIKKMND